MSCRFLQNKCFIYLVRRTIHRKFSTEQADLPELDVTVKDDIENNKLKPRKHPGIMKVGTCSLPDNIVEAVHIISEDHHIKNIISDAKVLSNYLFSRHYPLEDEDLREKWTGLAEDVRNRMGELPTEASEEQARHYNSLVRSSVTHLMNKYSYKWSALELNNYSCIVYLFTRAAPNYAAVSKVFHEITKRCPNYRPTSLFDFGSGVGSVSWAAKSCWGDSLQEYMNIDSSDSMNSLAEQLVCGGYRTEEPLQGIYYRAFLPAQHRKYSIVVTAHSLMELPNRESRLHLLLNLWKKTEDFLVVIEQGTKPGFKVVVEARDFLLSLADKSSAHVLAPCPHDVSCPRFLRGPYPCHFQTVYWDLAVGKKQEVKKELLSYVIIKKGKRGEETEWPRVVRPVLKRHRHVICRMCTEHGDLREIIFTKYRHGKVLYKCAKVTLWGDRLPVKLPASHTADTSPDESKKGSSEDESNPP